MDLIAELNGQIEDLDSQIRDEAEDRPAVALLQTVPCFGPYRSLVLVAEIRPIEQFPSPNHLVSFAGLALS